MAMARQTVNVFESPTKHYFEDNIYPKRQPALLKNLNLGACTEKWTADYLADTAGAKSVKIHVSATPQMDFIQKNFLYRTLPFNEFVQKASASKQKGYFICEEEKYYLRSLGEDPRKDIADIRKDFPALAQDIVIPPFFEEDKFYSSVFRISSQGVQLWTHYDVMDNLLILVSGRKRVVLFKPSDALHLYLNGDKSEVLDIDNPDLEKFPDFPNATRYECLMEPGDVLFIPALWFHNVINVDWGVAVNVFWRHLGSEMYDSRDTYGNKDLAPASRAMQVVDRAIKILGELPDEYKDFYARRLVSRVQDKAFIQKPS